MFHSKPHCSCLCAIDHKKNLGAFFLLYGILLQCERIFLPMQCKDIVRANWCLQGGFSSLAAFYTCTNTSICPFSINLILFPYFIGGCANFYLLFAIDWIVFLCFLAVYNPLHLIFYSYKKNFIHLFRGGWSDVMVFIKDIRWNVSIGWYSRLFRLDFLSRHFYLDFFA